MVCARLTATSRVGGAGEDRFDRREAAQPIAVDSEAGARAVARCGAA